MGDLKKWLPMLSAVIVLMMGACSPNFVVRETIEAENCDREADCRLEGHWKEWAQPGFSNGKLINNESTLGEAADSSKLFLTFQGTGIVIVFRRDTWYGSLRVEIDDRVKSIRQRGMTVRNQAEARFKVHGEGTHSLVLSGSKKRGVITVDAIKPNMSPDNTPIT